MQYTYGPYGNTANSVANANTIKYTGREQDLADLYYYRNRYYKPSTGRFISEDPIGLSGGSNLYAYVGGNPVNAVDPTGLDVIYLGANIDLSSVVAGINYLLGTNIIGTGGGVGIALSAPGLNGGEFDLGLYATGRVGGGFGSADSLTKAFKRVGVGADIELGYCAGSVSDMAGRGSNIGFMDGVGGLSVNRDENDNLQGVGVHLGVGSLVGINGTMTGTASVRRGVNTK